MFSHVQYPGSHVTLYNSVSTRVLEVRYSCYYVLLVTPTRTATLSKLSRPAIINEVFAVQEINYDGLLYWDANGELFP